ncbi:MAG TPA: Ldh family oxidoreductase, partial [Dehalococcoidia bacterium]|nr:Ldh family oxidoreductase [Dehalococcoidia bacterium]
MLTFTAEYLRDLGTRIFEAAGAPRDIAAEVARSLVDANLAGHDSHGVLRIPSYLDLIPSGQLKPAARPEIVKETPTSLLVDGHRTFGQISGLFATDGVVQKAKSQGIA